MNPHNIRLVALDMDGTLLHEDKHISRRTLQTVQKLADAGIRVVPATGRGLDGLRGTILQVSPICHAICSNGAAIQDPAKRGRAGGDAYPHPRGHPPVGILQGAPALLLSSHQSGTHPARGLEGKRPGGPVPLPAIRYLNRT